MNVFEWAVSSVLGSPNSQSGAIDVIAVRKPDGTLSCSPFHVKLGKASKSGEKRIVKLKVNGKDVELSMKLGPAGEAFFVERSRDFRRDPNESFPSSPRVPNSNGDMMSPREDKASTIIHVDIRNNASEPPEQGSSGQVLASEEESAQLSSEESSGKVATEPEVEVEIQTLTQTPAQESPTSKSKRLRSLSEGDAMHQAARSATNSAVSAASTASGATSTAQVEHVSGKNSSPAVPVLAFPVPPFASTLADTASEEPVAEESAASWIWKWGALPKKKNKPNKSSADLEGLHHATLSAEADGQATAPIGSTQEGGKSTASGGAGLQSGGKKLSVRDRAVSLPVLMHQPLDDDEDGPREGGDHHTHHTHRRRQTHHHHKHHHGQHRDLHHQDAFPRRTPASFTQQVTAVEEDIAGLSGGDSPLNSPLSSLLSPLSPIPAELAEAVQGATARDFASMFEAARGDTSRFHALSLCGHLLSSASSVEKEQGETEGEDKEEECEEEKGAQHQAYPTSEAELRAVLEAHLITPHDIVEVVVEAETDADTNPATATVAASSTTAPEICPSVLSNPALVVILDDFLLPIHAAERLLRKMCSHENQQQQCTVVESAMDAECKGEGEGGAHESRSPHSAVEHLSAQDVAAVLAELRAEGHAVQGWAGRRISQWGMTRTTTSTTTASADAESMHHHTPASPPHATTSTAHPPLAPLGQLSWQQSFSDLVQAYRVQNIHTIHSYMNLNAHNQHYHNTATTTTSPTANPNPNPSSLSTAPLLQDLTLAPGRAPLNYKELWHRQTMGKSQSFTALLTLDAGTIHSMYASEADLDRWAVGNSYTNNNSTSNSLNNSMDVYDHDHHYNAHYTAAQDADSSFVSQHSTGSVGTGGVGGSGGEGDCVSEGGYGVGVGYTFHHHSDRGGGIGSVHSSHHSLPMLELMESIDEVGHSGEGEVEREGSGGSSGKDSGKSEGSGHPATTTTPATTANTTYTPSGSASYVHDAPLRSLHHTTSATTSATPYFSTEEEHASTTANNTDGDTDNDNVSLQDIDFEDISPEPAAGDFYESDTDSYLSLSLEDGETGKGGNSKGGSRGNSADYTYTDTTTSADGTTTTTTRRRFRRYLYRKVLVPSQDQLATLDLQDGPNEIQFELPGCAPLRSTLFVWPSDCKIVVTDIEGVFTKSAHNSGTRSSGVWIQFLGGGSYYSYSNQQSKTEYDAVIRLFRALHKHGYRIIYIAQTGTNTTSINNALLSSQEYLHSIKTSTGECLPPGPIFKSPDSLVRAFGAARTDVFKAGALKGVKSLFPSSHNPYHACFCIREGDAIPFARFGFPEGRIFLVAEKGELKIANRTASFSFPRLLELLHQIFPHVVDSQSGNSSTSISGVSGKLTHTNSGGLVGKNLHYTSAANSTKSASSASGGTGQDEITTTNTAANATTTSTTTSNIYTTSVNTINTATSPLSLQTNLLSPISPGPASNSTRFNTNTYTNTTSVLSPTNTAASTTTSLISPKGSIPFSKLSNGTEDTYNDFNFWKIPPQIIEDDY